MQGKYYNDILNIFDEIEEENKILGYKICTVKSLSPLMFTLDSIDIGESLGDTIYIHPLFISEKISQDENSIYNIQNFNSSSAYNSPSFQAKIEGDLPDFIKKFYLFYKNWQSIFLIKEQDKVVVYELGENRYLILQKIIEYKGEEN